MALEPGTEVGGYEVLDRLGSGGMASVWRVKHQVLGSTHALKVLRPDLVANAGIRQRFLDEGRLQAQLKHPGIVRVTDLVSEPGIAGLVMDLIVGTPLDEELEKGALGVEAAVGWMLQVLGAVHYAHEFGVVHRDLKPSNLFIADPHGEGSGVRRRTMKVLDFGIAKVAGRSRTLNSETVGTYAYMSPEQVRNAASVDRRSDLFALGAVLFEMVTGHPAFAGDTDYATMQRVASAERIPPEVHGANLPPSLERALDRALAREPEDRFATAEEFAQALERLARPEDLAMLEDWEGVEAPPPVLLGGEASATWNGTMPGLEESPLAELSPGALNRLDRGLEDDIATLQEGTQDLARPLNTEERTMEPGPLQPLQPLPERSDLPTEAPDTEDATLSDAPTEQAPVTALVEDGPHRVSVERHEIAVRVAGAAQIVAGLINTFGLWLVMCWGLYGGVPAALSLIGLPPWLAGFGSCASLLGCGLLILGPIEILTGLRAVLGGASGRRPVLRTAVLELVALAFGGLPSFLVGLGVTGLLLALPEPGAAREPTRR
jgi:serine/threonine protein kinase